VVLATIKVLVLARGLPVYLDSPESFGSVVMGPVTAMFTYLLAVFSFGLDGDLAARQSMYPARMFTRPLTTGAPGWSESRTSPVTSFCVAAKNAS